MNLPVTAPGWWEPVSTPPSTGFPTIPDWLPGNSGKPSASEINFLSAPRQTVGGRNTYVPLAYGRVRADGKVFFAMQDEAGEFLYVGFALCEGVVDSIESVLVDGIPVTDPTEGLLLKAGAQVVTHDGVNTLPDALLAGVVSDLGLGTYTDVLDGVAYVVIKFPAKSTNGFPRVEAIVKGYKVYDPRKDSTNGGSGTHRLATPSTWEWSDNPTLCFAHFAVQHAGWGLDWPSIIETANFNDVLIGGVRGRVLNLLLENQANATQWAQGFRVYMGAYLAWEDGLLRVIPDRKDVDPTVVGFNAALDSADPDDWHSVGVAYHFTEDDIRAGSLSLSHRNKRDTPNSIIVEYTFADLQRGWLTLPVQVETAEAETGQRRTSRVSLPGIHDASQAKREAIERLNWFVADLEGSLQVFDEGLLVQNGSIIAITHSVGLTKALFRVVGIGGNQGRWSLSLSEYDPDMYSTEVVSPPDVVDPVAAGPSPYLVPDITGLAADEELVTNSSGISTSRVRATWTAIASDYLDYYVFEAYIGTTLVYQGTSQTNEALVPNVDQLVSGVPVVLTVKVAARFQLAIGNFTSTTTTIAGNTANPLDVPSLTITRTGADTADLTWPSAAANNVSFYEVRKTTSASAGDWATGVLAYFGPDRRAAVKGLAIGTSYFMVRAKSVDGVYSANPAVQSIAIAAAPAPSGLTLGGANNILSALWGRPAMAVDVIRRYKVSYVPPGGGSPVAAEEVDGLTWAKGGLPVGSYTVTVTSVDTAGRDGGSVSDTVTVELADLTDVAAALDQEILDRTAAVAAEASARATGISDEAATRAAAILAEQTAREAAITTEQTIRQTADDSLASAISTLAAGTGEQFDSAKVWYFDVDLESWTGNFTPTVSGGYLRPGNGTNSYVDSPDNININASTYNYIKLRLRKVGSPTWDGAMYWNGSGDTVFDEGRRVDVPEPGFQADGDATIDYLDIPWSGTLRRLRFRLGTAQSATDYYLIDWIAVGRPSPGASVAALQDEAVARVNGDAAEATARTTLATQMRGGYTGTDITALTSGLLYSERQARSTADTAMASDITALQSTVNNPSTGVAATAAAVSALDTRITAAEGVNTSQASSITSINTSLSTKSFLSGSGNNLVPDEFSYFDTAVAAPSISATGGTAARDTAQKIISPASIKMVSSTADNYFTFTSPAGRYISMIGGKKYIISMYQYSSQANAVLQCYVTAANGDNRFTTFPTPTLAANTWGRVSAVIDLSALTGTLWDLRVDNHGASGVTTYIDGLMIEEQVGSGTTPSAYARGTTAGKTVANTSAISALDTRVTAAEGSITSQASSITSLSANLDATRLGGVGGNRLLNPSLTNGDSTGWQSSHGFTPTYSPRLGCYHFAGVPGSATRYIVSQIASNTYNNATVGEVSTFSADVQCDGTWYLSIQYRDGAGTVLGNTDSATQAANSSFVRFSVTSNPAPSGTVFFTVVLYATNTTSNFRMARPKMELNSFPTPYSEETRIAGNASAISGLDTRVTAAEGSITSQASAITALNASVGGGVNMMLNASLDAGLYNMSGGGGAGWGAITLDLAGATWYPPGIHTVGRTRGGATAAGSYADIYWDKWAVKGSTAYIASVYVASHRSSTYFYIQWLDSSGGFISYSPASPVNAMGGGSSGVGAGGQDLNNWVRLMLNQTAPSNARYATILCRVEGNGSNDPYGWFCRPQFEEKLPAQTAPSPWSNSTSGMAASSAVAALDARVTTTENGLTVYNASYTVSLNANGVATGFTSVTNGVTSAFKVQADLFQITSSTGSGSGQRFEYSSGNIRIYDTSNVLRVRLGVW